MRLGYHQLLIRPTNILKTAFRMSYRHYEFIVMLLGLTNAPSIFIDLINQVFCPYLDQFIIAFINDILIYSKIEEEHTRQLQIALHSL